MLYANYYLSIHSHVTLILVMFIHEAHPPLSLFLLNPRVDKMGHQGQKQFIFTDQYYWKNARNLRFHVIKYFHARKRMILSYLK